MFLFFLQAEDGIRDYKVTGVQTCALPIFCAPPLNCSDVGSFASYWKTVMPGGLIVVRPPLPRLCSWPYLTVKNGRASCRERGMSACGSILVEGKETTSGSK